MNKFPVLLLVLFSGTVQAKELRLLEADALSMEYSKIYYYRDQNMPQFTNYRESSVEEWSFGAAVNFDLCLICYGDYKMFWDNKVHMTSTESQVRHVGWFWELGFNLVPDFLDVFYRHHSEHCLECNDNTGALDTRWYRVKDEAVVRIHLYQHED